MNKLKPVAFCLVLITGLLFLFNQPANAAKVHYNHVPSVLHHNWVSPLYRTPKSQRTPYNQYWYTNLHPSNTRFQLEGFVLNKNLGNNNNSGPYGAFKGYWALGYQRLSSHRYLAFGTLYEGSKCQGQFKNVGFWQLLETIKKLINTGSARISGIVTNTEKGVNKNVKF